MAKAMKHPRVQEAPMAKKFHYSSCWGTWSRVLTDDGPHHSYVEVNLTPVNGNWQDRVAPVRIRVHGTARDFRDIDTDELPAAVYQRMVDNLGEELTERLLNEDFIPQIDFARYRAVCNGGANLEDIRVQATV
jgi:hypothetical protein